MATGRIGTTPVLTTRWSKQPAAGTTSLSGLDDNSVSLVYSVGYEAVYRNGTLLSRGNDYTATNGTTITLVDATLTGDIIEVFANQTVPLTDTYSQTVANSLFVNQATFDAKGDLIAGTADNAYTKLSVGSNGDTLVADSSQTTGLRYNPPVGSLANPVINGGMDIWQRGTSSLTTTNGYTADRWYTYKAAGAHTISRQVTGDTTNLPNIQYCARVQRNSGQTNTDRTQFTNPMETATSIPFAGKPITLTFYARKGADYSASSSNLQVLFSTGTGTDQKPIDGYTGGVDIISTNVVLTTSWQRFALTATVGSTATEMAVNFLLNWAGTAGTNDYVEITGVQVDVGTWTATTAPTFRRSGNTLAGEVLACQRYYWRWTAGDAYTPYGMALKTTATAAQWVLQFPVEMRARVTSLEFSSLISSNAAGNGAITAMTLGWWGKNTARIDITNNSVGVADTPTLIQSNNNSSAYFAINAEL